MRIAAVDIGTNSIHMIVVQVRPDRSFEVIDREKEYGPAGLGRSWWSRPDRHVDDHGVAGPLAV